MKMRQTMMVRLWKYRHLGSLLLLCLMVGVSQGQTSGVQIAGAWTSGLNHAASSGSNRLLILTAHTEHSAAIRLNSVTYGGQAMTLVREQLQGISTRNYTAVFMLGEAQIAQATGSAFVPTWSVTPLRTPAFSSVFLTEVNQ